MSSDLHVDIVGNGSNAAEVQYGNDGYFSIDDIARDRDHDIVERLQIPANLAINTYYYPGSDGVSTYSLSGVMSLLGTITAGVSTNITLTIEGTNNLASPATWVSCTELFVLNNAVSGNANIVVTASTVYSFALSLKDPPYRHFRVKIVIADGASNTIILDLLRRA